MRPRNPRVRRRRPQHLKHNPRRPLPILLQQLQQEYRALSIRLHSLELLQFLHLLSRHSAMPLCNPLQQPKLNQRDLQHPNQGLFRLQKAETPFHLRPEPAKPIILHSRLLLPPNPPQCLRRILRRCQFLHLQVPLVLKRLLHQQVSQTSYLLHILLLSHLVNMELLDAALSIHQVTIKMFMLRNGRVNRGGHRRRIMHQD